MSGIFRRWNWFPTAQSYTGENSCKEISEIAENCLPRKIHREYDETVNGRVEL